MLVREQHTLPTLRLCMAGTAADPEVRAELWFGDHRLFGATYPAVAFGIPRSAEPLATGWARARCRIPEQLAERLRATVDGERLDRLWLEFPPPNGLLPLLPWENQIGQALGVPVLRLPYFSLRPLAPHMLTVVLCASAPAAKGSVGISELLPYLAYAYRRLDRPVQVHIFTDRAAYDEINRYGDAGGVILHDPREAAEYPPAERLRAIDDGSVRLSPWLAWIRDALGGQAADVVHFAGHGYLSAGRGAVAFAESPVVNTDTTWARFVGIEQLSAFLSQVGAWSVALTAVPENYSATGLTALADSLAQLRAGYVIRHDLQAASADEILEALAFLYDRAPAPRTPNVAYWVHPQLAQERPGARPRGDWDLLMNEDSATTIFAPGTRAAIDAPSTPSWIASSARVLEQAQALWLDQPYDRAEVLDRQAAVEALTFAATLLEQQVTATRSGLDGGLAAGGEVS
ncbi:hypothetical protein [Hamadaea tsunoensis]|uniref:hypothetical protein n=1 Tax=Hamadaea tsunoensis TaxID=53368 RepID=UPI0004174929|nr:hypothetical protein [Hamadaea tsunoensis]